MPGRGPTGFGERLFGGLGRGLVRHPWYPIVFWVVLLAVALPFLGRIGSVTTNSTTSVPSSAPSSVAQAEISRLFPNSTVGSASEVLVLGPNITGPAGQALVVQLGTALASDQNLTYVRSVDTLYSAYRQYLIGEVAAASEVLSPALGTAPTLPAEVNGSAQLLWGGPAGFAATWSAMVAGSPSTPPGQFNYPAYHLTRTALGGNVSAVAVLDAMYGLFNGSLNCAATPAQAFPCVDQAARTGVGPILPNLTSSPAGAQLFVKVLDTLAVENFSAWAGVRTTVADLLSDESGVPARWLLTVWTNFTNGVGTPGQVASWSDRIATSIPVAGWPLPIPASLSSAFLSPDGRTTLVYVTFTKDSGYVDANGGNPIYDDVAEISHLVDRVVPVADPTATFQLYQTGPAALDQTQSADLNSSLAIVLPLTVLVLILITIAYFRAPLAPMLTFGGLGMAIVLSLAGVVLIGTLVTHVDSTALTLENTFVLGVGTDYSIFLVARYREELVAGRPPHEALVTSVTWAGQSIATSGATAIIATLALAFSGVALLSQWGMVLSLAILITVLVSLTVVPALLALLGPRVFWPTTGAKFERRASADRARIAGEQTYFYRAGRLTQRRPKVVVALVLLASIPLLYVALNVPISYDFYQQLPSGQPATEGLAKLGQAFGEGFTFPMTGLVTFAQPLVVGNQTNAAEFRDLGNVVSYIGATGGVARVDSPLGPSGAPPAQWANLSTLPPVTRATLLTVLSSYVGVDGRTVAVTIYTTSSGLSQAAVTTLDHLRSNLTDYESHHSDVTQVAFGGGAAVTSDLKDQTFRATEQMAILVSVGLLLVLLVVLRSWWIPPMAVATIGLSIGWAWGTTYLALGVGLGYPLFFFVPTVMFILILGLGIDYNIFLLTRVREERLHGRSASEAVVQAVARTGGIITAAAVILASAFAILLTGSFILLRAIGFAVAIAIVLDAAVVRTYLVPSLLHLLGDRVWAGFGRKAVPGTPPETAETAPTT